MNLTQIREKLVSVGRIVELTDELLVFSNSPDLRPDKKLEFLKATSGLRWRAKEVHLILSDELKRAEHRAFREINAKTPDKISSATP